MSLNFMINSPSVHATVCTVARPRDHSAAPAAPSVRRLTCVEGSHGDVPPQGAPFAAGSLTLAGGSGPPRAPVGRGWSASAASARGAGRRGLRRRRGQPCAPPRPCCRGGRRGGERTRSRQHGVSRGAHWTRGPALPRSSQADSLPPLLARGRASSGSLPLPPRLRLRPHRQAAGGRRCRPRAPQDSPYGASGKDAALPRGTGQLRWRGLVLRD